VLVSVLCHELCDSEPSQSYLWPCGSEWDAVRCLVPSRQTQASSPRPVPRRRQGEEIWGVEGLRVQECLQS
jgi:hypothetical protein